MKTQLLKPEEREKYLEKITEQWDHLNPERKRDLKKIIDLKEALWGDIIKIMEQQQQELERESEMLNDFFKELEDPEQIPPPMVPQNSEARSA